MNKLINNKVVLNALVSFEISEWTNIFDFSEEQINEFIMKYKPNFKIGKIFARSIINEIKPEVSMYVQKRKDIA